MAIKKKTSKPVSVESYTHSGAKRKNIPTAKMAAEGRIPKVKKARYSYSPHLTPELQFDADGLSDRLAGIIEKACAGQQLTTEEQKVLRSICSVAEQPWLEWAGKKEEHDQRWMEVEPVALHIHERVSANAIIRAAFREDVERDLFADPQQEYKDAVQFYQHDIDWANRMILGDSLEVMSSLSRREDLAGKVQMIFIDPPYGIRFKSNFQPTIGNKNVQDSEKDMTRETEMVKAYRDTWNLGIHSYLGYLRNRLTICRNLLTDSGSIFVQISEENVHRVRQLMEEIFGPENFIAQIWFRKKLMPLGGKTLEGMGDYLLWFAKNRGEINYSQLYVRTTPDPSGRWTGVSDKNLNLRRLTPQERKKLNDLPEGIDLFGTVSQWAPSFSPKNVFPFQFNGDSYTPTPRQCWVTSEDKMIRLANANRLFVEGDFPRFVSFHSDFEYKKLTHPWHDTAPAPDKLYVVVTNTEVVRRCMLMTTSPGDLVLDPTCGSGTTAVVAEDLGRRWITVDSSRVSVSIARQRLITAHFPRYRLDKEVDTVPTSNNKVDLSAGGDFCYLSAPRISLKNIVGNENLDPIFDKYKTALDEALDRLNECLEHLTDELRAGFIEKLAFKAQQEGLRQITDSDCRRWLLPGTKKEQVITAFAGKSKLKQKHVDQYFALVPSGSRYHHWQVPFDSDLDWPEHLIDSLHAYHLVWRRRMEEISSSIKLNADQQLLVDQPDVIKNVVRVSGPFTVESVRPEELSLTENVDSTDLKSNEWETEGSAAESVLNASAYIDRITQLLRQDGVTFPNNEHREFQRIEQLYNTDTNLHGEAIWKGKDNEEIEDVCNIALAFGPQHGPVTAEQVEDLIRASRRYDELVIAGFSFDGAAQTVIQESANPRLKIHMAHIRPDVSPGMDGLLKDTSSSQIFSVFGQPEIELKLVSENEIETELLGVDIYDPISGQIRSEGGAKVAAWFLDQDYDGRCFCITQAFFPNQKAWGKIAKAIGSEAEALAQYGGTKSLPFEVGKHKRIAVKVIDPRGNEVMAIRSLEGVA